MQPFIETENTWVTRAGRAMRVSQMDNDHLRNAIKMLYRNGWTLAKAPVLKAMLNELINRRLLLH